MKNEIKEIFIKKLYDRNEFIRKVRDDLFLVRCPYCGDSLTPDHAHFYIKVDISDDSPILYYCHKCPARGAVTKETLERLGIDDLSLSSGITNLNKNNKFYDKKKINSEDTIEIFDYKIPEIKYMSPKLKYIEDRLQVGLSQLDVKNIKVIESIKEFNRINDIKKPTCNYWMEQLFENNYVGFLSYGSSHILFRDITGTQELSWIKYPITAKSYKNKIFYSISSAIDIYTNEDITINLFEGVFDALSIYLNFQKETPNSVFIAVTGKYYEFIIMYLISNGLFGSNVTLNVYADNDKVFNKKNKENDTTLEYYEYLFRNYKYLFKEVNVIYNILAKDCGYPKNMISLDKHRL